MRFFRYADLKARGVVGSRMTLGRLIDQQGFPRGRLITPNCRAWTEDEIDAWLASRPVARKPVARNGESAREPVARKAAPKRDAIAEAAKDAPSSRDKVAQRSHNDAAAAPNIGGACFETRGHQEKVA